MMIIILLGFYSLTNIPFNLLHINIDLFINSLLLFISLNFSYNIVIIIISIFTIISNFLILSLPLFRYNSLNSFDNHTQLYCEHYSYHH